MNHWPMWWCGCGVLALSLGACVADDLSAERDLARWSSDAPAAPGDMSEFDPDDGDTTPKVLNGEETLERPEIGGITVGNGFCTATLIRKNIVVTAAHCVDYYSRTRPGNHGRFDITQSDGQKVSFPVDLIFSFRDRYSSQKDIALARLARDVPPEVARPTALSTREANPGEQVTIYGYGCTRRNGGGDSGVKRKFTTAYGTTRNLCSGDSGGPVVIGDGPIFMINSGYITNTGEDVFGHIWTHRDTLIEQIVAWGGDAEPEANPDANPDPTPDPDEPNFTGVTVLNNTGASLWLHCARRTTSSSCSGWTLVDDGDSTFIKTPNKGVYLYNVNQGAPVIFNLRKVYADDDALTIHANDIDPTSPDGGQLPDDPNAVYVRNATGARLFVHCNGREAREGCTGWVTLRDGDATLMKTPGRVLYLHNLGQNTTTEFNVQRLPTDAKEVTIYDNPDDPLVALE